MVHDYYVYDLIYHPSKGDQVNFQSFTAVHHFVCDSGTVFVDLDFATYDVSYKEHSSLQHKSFVHRCLRPCSLAIRFKLLLGHPINHFVNTTF